MYNNETDVSLIQWSADCVCLSVCVSLSAHACVVVEDTTVAKVVLALCESRSFKVSCRFNVVMTCLFSHCFKHCAYVCLSVCLSHRITHWWCARTFCIPYKRMVAQSC